MRIESGNVDRVQRIKRVQRVANVKDSTYYTRRRLTKEDQTGEISGNLRSSERISNLSAKEIFDMENAKNQNSKLYNQLQGKRTETEPKTEQDRVKKLKSEYKQKENNYNIHSQKQNEEAQEQEEQER